MNLRLLRAVALVEAVEASGLFAGLSFFASASAPNEGYEVHTCVGIPTGALESLPAFDGAVIDRVYVGRSLQHEVVAECLRRADQVMFLPVPGAGLYALGASADDIVRAAAVRVIDGTVYHGDAHACGPVSGGQRVRLPRLRAGRGGRTARRRRAGRDRTRRCRCASSDRSCSARRGS